jgi:hypothetical protein
MIKIPMFQEFKTMEEWVEEWEEVLMEAWEVVWVVVWAVALEAPVMPADKIPIPMSQEHNSILMIKIPMFQESKTTEEWAEEWEEEWAVAMEEDVEEEEDIDTLTIKIS